MAWRSYRASHGEACRPSSVRDDEPCWLLGLSRSPWIRQQFRGYRPIARAEMGPSDRADFGGCATCVLHRYSGVVT
jgi:hypothetical protein